MKEDDSSLPAPDGPWAYAVRYETGAQHPLHVRTLRGGGPEQVLLDEPKLGEGKPFFNVGSGQHSPRPRPLRLCGGRAGVGVLRDPHRRPGHRRDAARR